MALEGESSSASLDHKKSTSFKAIQLMVMTVKVGGMADSEMTELTTAVLPVPGDPEMYKEAYCTDAGFLASSTNDVMNSLMSARSVARPDNGDVPFDVDLRSARARAYMGTSTDGGVGGGVASVKCEKVEEGVLVSRLEVEKCLLGAMQRKQTKSGTLKNSQARVASSLRAFLGEVWFSVAVLLIRLGDGDSGRGGMFSLFPSGFNSIDVLVVLIRFAVGVTSGVGKSRGQEGESEEDWDRLPSTEPCMTDCDGNAARPGRYYRIVALVWGSSPLFVHREERCRQQITRRRWWLW